MGKTDFCIEVEQKRYETLNKSYTDTKNRRLLLLSVEMAIFTFLFSNLQDLIPNELYGIIFFAIGALAAVASLVLSFYHCRPASWPDPIGPVEKVKIEATTEENVWKQIALEDYEAANRECKRLLEVYAKTLKWSLFFFVVSITILLIIKYF